MTVAVHMRALSETDTDAALSLYNELTFGPVVDDPLAVARAINHDGTSIYGAFAHARLVAMLTLHILPNPTWGGRPYGLVENVVTTASYQRRGIGKALMQHAITAAWNANAFKVMLMTGKKREATGFYEAAGFNAEDKTAMIIRRP